MKLILFLFSYEKEEQLENVNIKLRCFISIYGEYNLDLTE